VKTLRQIIGNLFWFSLIAAWSNHFNWRFYRISRKYVILIVFEANAFINRRMKKEVSLKNVIPLYIA